MTSDKWIEELKTDIRRRRLEALKKTKFAIPEVKSQKRPWQAPSYYHWMETWSEKAEGQIASAITKGVYFANLMRVHFMNTEYTRTP